MSITISKPVAPVYNPGLPGIASIFTPMAAVPFVLANARRTGTGSIRPLLALAAINLLLGANFLLGIGLLAWPVAMAATYIVATRHPSWTAAVVQDIPVTWQPGVVDAIGSIVCGVLGLFLVLFGMLAIPLLSLLVDGTLLGLFF